MLANPTHVGMYQSSVLFYLNPCRKPHIRGDVSACADCTPSGQFAPSVISVNHAKDKTCQGCVAPTKSAALDRFFLRDTKSAPTGNAPEGLSVPPAGGTAKAGGGVEGVYCDFTGYVIYWVKRIVPSGQPFFWT